MPASGGTLPASNPFPVTPWHDAQRRYAFRPAAALPPPIAAVVVTWGSDATCAATALLSVSERICRDIACILRPSTSSACRPRMPFWNRSSCAETYQAGRPAIAGAPTTVEPSPAAPWQGTHASNSSAPEIDPVPASEAATELRAQPVIARTPVRLPTVAIIRTNGMPIRCHLTGPPGAAHETRLDHSLPRVIARELSTARPIPSGSQLTRRRVQKRWRKSVQRSNRYSFLDSAVLAFGFEDADLRGLAASSWYCDVEAVLRSNPQAGPRSIPRVDPADTLQAVCVARDDVNEPFTADHIQA